MAKPEGPQKRWVEFENFEAQVKDVYYDLVELGFIEEDKDAPPMPTGRRAITSKYSKVLVTALKQKKAKSPDSREISRLKRELYSKIGLLEVEFIRKRFGLDEVKRAQYEKLFKEMNDSLKIVVKKDGPSFLGAVKMFAAITYLVVTALPILMLLPLRMLHPTLRKYGVKNNKLPIDLLQRLYASGYCRIFGVHAEVEGTPDEGHSTIMFFQHGSNLDPFVITAFSPIVAKWIGKKSIFYLPVFGWLAYGFGMIPIDRGNLKKAIGSLEAAKRRIEKWNRSVAISPEGTRSTSGQLASFKKGPFHLAHQTKLPVTPVLIQGAYELWPPGQMWPTPGDVKIRFLDPIKPKEGESIEELQMRVREKFLKNIPDMEVPKSRPPTVSDTIFPLLQLVLPAAFVYSRM